MTKTEIEIKLKELEGDVLRLRLEVARLERESRSRPTFPYVPEPIKPHEHPWIPRRIHWDVGDTDFTPRVTCTGIVDPVRDYSATGGH